MNSTVIAVDLAKSVFEVGVSRHPGKVSERHRLVRHQMLPFFAEREPAVVVLEACGSAHYWSRELSKLGHEVRLLPPHAVRPYVPRNKTDRTDTKGLLEAYRNEAIHPVPTKTVFQQSLTTMHRLRTSWVETRTARINSLRAALREQGWTIPVGAKRVVPQASALLSDRSNELLDPLRGMLQEVVSEIVELEQRIEKVDKQLKALAQGTALYERLLSIPGVGPLTATALIASLGELTRFKNGRHLASFLGLTPREHSSGPKRHLGGISKQGDSYLRTLLIHGARAVLIAAKRHRERDQLRSWALGIEQRRGHNTAAVAVANKLARVIWVVWTRDVRYQEHWTESAGREAVSN